MLSAFIDKQDGTVPGGKTKNPVSEIEVSLFYRLPSNRRAG